VIGGGSYEQFTNQFIRRLHCPPALLKISLSFPQHRMAFYRYRHGGWKKVYRKVLKRAKRKRSLHAFDEVYDMVGYVPPKKVWGEVIEDRDTQMSFSPLGQKIVDELGSKKGIALKEQWRKENNPLRLKIVKLLGKKAKRILRFAPEVLRPSMSHKKASIRPMASGR
jgi:hypothetical protein